MKNSKVHGFSMVEVALALGIVVFAMLPLVALLPFGLKNNQISAEETRAVNLLSTLEADLRNTHPELAGGFSRIYGLRLPYVLDSSGGFIPNPAIETGNNPSGPHYTVALDEQEREDTTSPRPRYQVSVRYLSVPAADDPGGIRARLVVNWPSATGDNATDISSFTDPSKVDGFIEAVVLFPRP